MPAALDTSMRRTKPNSIKEGLAQCLKRMTRKARKKERTSGAAYAKNKHQIQATW
jgi:hypothetical protein